MEQIDFEWNELKSALNFKKHGVSFEEASTVFYDERAILFDDPAHSITEERFLILGVSKKLRICIVSHCLRNSDQTIRIISARKATKREVDAYINNQKEGLLR